MTREPIVEELTVLGAMHAPEPFSSVANQFADVWRWNKDHDWGLTVEQFLNVRVPLRWTTEPVLRPPVLVPYLPAGQGRSGWQRSSVQRSALHRTITELMIAARECCDLAPPPLVIDPESDTPEGIRRALRISMGSWDDFFLRDFNPGMRFASVCLLEPQIVAEGIRLMSGVEIIASMALHSDWLNHFLREESMEVGLPALRIPEESRKMPCVDQRLMRLTVRPIADNELLTFPAADIDEHCFTPPSP